MSKQHIIYNFRAEIQGIGSRSELRVTRGFYYYVSRSDSVTRHNAPHNLQRLQHVRRTNVSSQLCVVW